MSAKKHKYNEKRFPDTDPPKDNRGEPVPGTGHDTKRAKQKMVDLTDPLLWVFFYLFHE